MSLVTSTDTSVFQGIIKSNTLTPGGTYLFSFTQVSFCD